MVNFRAEPQQVFFSTGPAGVCVWGGGLTRDRISTLRQSCWLNRESTALLLFFLNVSHVTRSQPVSLEGRSLHQAAVELRVTGGGLGSSLLTGLSISQELPSWSSWAAHRKLLRPLPLTADGHVERFWPRLRSRPLLPLIHAGLHSPCREQNTQNPCRRRPVITWKVSGRFRGRGRRLPAPTDHPPAPPPRPVP